MRYASWRRESNGDRNARDPVRAHGATSTFGRLGCFAPEGGPMICGPGESGRTGGQSSFRQITATQIMGISRLNILLLHDRPSFSSHPARFTVCLATSQQPLMAVSGTLLPTAPVTERGQAPLHRSPCGFMPPRYRSSMQLYQLAPQLLVGRLLIAWHRGSRRLQEDARANGSPIAPARIPRCDCRSRK